MADNLYQEDELQPEANSHISNPVVAKTGIEEVRDPLEIDLDPEVFLKRSKQLINDSKDKFNARYNLTDRRRELEKYLFGRQLQDKKLKPYKSKSQDNLIYEAETYLRSIALSRLPDLLVSPGNDTKEDKDAAEKLSKLVTNDIQSRKRKRVLSLAFRHLPVYFTGVIKYFWNPELGKDGDYDFVTVNPDNIVVDFYSPTNDPRDMQFVAESVEYSVREWVMRFPDKEQDIYDELRKMRVFKDSGLNESKDEGMNSLVKGWEVWFDWYDKAGSKQQYTLLSGVGWTLGDLCLKVMKNPNWDWTGEQVKFSWVLDPVTGQKTKKIANQMDIQSSILGTTDTTFQTQTIFHNHFDNPEKPYIFLGYDNWGKTPLDETSRIEQAVPMQQMNDKRIKQIDEMLDRSRGKNVFSTEAGLKTEDLEELDMSDPDTDILVDGIVSDVFTHVPGEQPSPQVIQNYNDSGEKVFNKIGIHGPTRGEGTGGRSNATSTQILREADFTRADDLSDDTIGYAAEKMANAILQLIKLRYTSDHFVRILGDDGNPLYLRINRDLVSDGMLVTISASGVDKLKAQQQAMDMAKIQMIDPLQFFKDMRVSDPVGRTEQLMMFKMDPAGYTTTYGMQLDSTQKQAQALFGAQPPQGQVAPGIQSPPGNPNVGPVGGAVPNPANPNQVSITPPGR